MPKETPEEAVARQARSAITGLRDRIRAAINEGKVAPGDVASLSDELDTAWGDPVTWHNGARASHEATVAGWEQG